MSDSLVHWGLFSHGSHNSWHHTCLIWSCSRKIRIEISNDSGPVIRWIDLHCTLVFNWCIRVNQLQVSFRGFLWVSDGFVHLYIELICSHWIITRVPDAWSVNNLVSSFSVWQLSHFYLLSLLPDWCQKLFSALLILALDFLEFLWILILVLLLPDSHLTSHSQRFNGRHIWIVPLFLRLLIFRCSLSIILLQLPELWSWIRFGLSIFFVFFILYLQVPLGITNDDFWCVSLMSL